MNTTDRAERERRLDEVATAYLQEIERGHAPRPEEWLARYPDLADELRAFFAAQDQVARLAAPLCAAAPASEARTQGSTAAAQGNLGTVRYFGDYELLEEIARGGMGVVYKARQTKLDRIVAVKMILAGELADPADVERFHTEARAAARLHHPNIVAIHEVGRHQGQHYYSMDYVGGDSLANRIARGPLPVREAAVLLVKVARAVAFAHVDGVIHRDLKPANILLDAQGEPHVTDFGLAKRVRSEPGSPATGGLTETGQVLGTPSYMPPEQAAGRTKEIGPRSDVYALGAVLYCTLTGRPPFQAASTLDTLLQVLDREPVSPRALNPAVSRDLETVCLKCLDKDPRRRYASAQELADELQRTLDGKPILARPIGLAGRAWRWCRRNPVVAAMSAALVLAIAAGVATSIVFALEARQEAAVSAGLAVKANQLAAQAQTAADSATAQERLTRRYLYCAHMNLAHEALKGDNLLRAVELLDQHRAAEGHEDLRSFEWRYLWRECHRERKTIPLAVGAKSHVVSLYGGAVATEIVVSPDGRWAAIGIMGASEHLAGEVRLVDLTTGALRQTFVGKIDKAYLIFGPDKDYRHLVFSPDSKLFAMVEWDCGPVKRPEWGDNTRERRPQTQQVTVWSLATLQLRATIPLPKFGFHDRIALSASAVAVGFSEEKAPFRTIKVWDLPADNSTAVGPGRVVPQGDKGAAFVPGEPNQPVEFRSCTFAPDGKTLAWTHLHGNLFLTDVSDGKNRSLPIHADIMVFSPDGKHLACWCGNGVRVLDTAGANEVLAVGAEALGRMREGFTRHPGTLCFSPDGRLLAVGRGLAVGLWDVQAKKQVGMVRWVRGPVRATGFGPDGRTLITVADTNDAMFWDVTTRPGPDELPLGPAPRHESVIRPGKLEDDRVAALAVAPDGKTLAVVWTTTNRHQDQRTVRLYDRLPGSLGHPIAELHGDAPKKFEPSAVTFSPDSKWLALSGWGEHDGELDGEHVQLWRISRGLSVKAKLERSFFAPQSHSDPGSPVVAFSRDGTRFAYAGCMLTFDKQLNHTFRSTDRVHVYDLSAGTARQLPAAADMPFLPPLFRGLSGVADWDRPYQGWCGGAVFSSDGKRLFTAHVWGSGSWIITWDAATGAPRAILKTRADLANKANALALSPDGRTLASCHGDSVHLWDVTEAVLGELHDRQRQQIEDPPGGDRANPLTDTAPKAVLRGHADPITAIAFHPEGKVLASASNDGTIKLWDLATGELRLTLDCQVADTFVSSYTIARPVTLTFTPDGKELLYGTRSGTLTVWRQE